MSETVGLSTGLASHIKPGLVIAGKYRLEQEIGRGSMGTVFRAVHVTLGQRVAIKLISGAHSQSAEMRQRFSMEAKAAAKLRSRHVVQVIDDGETPEGNPYIVLELLEGETLEQRVQREHDLPLGDAVRVVTHVGRALARAHAQGIVHRDLKPANVFLVKSDDDVAGWVAKVLDFGIAKIAQQAGTTRAGTVLGTPLFMSPEQVRGASGVDHRADLYSLGMCLFHMLSGEFAFYAQSYSEILVAICTQPLPLLRDKAPWVPEAVEQWFQRACAKEPIDRFQSADEMTEALQAAAGGASPLSKHKSVPEGRIASETLVGFAAPPMATVELKVAAPPALPLALDRTQPLHAVPEAQAVGRAVPVAVAIPRQDSVITGSAWLPPRRNWRPLLIGLGLGLLAMLSLGITFTLLGGSSARAPASSAAAPRANAPTAAAIEPPRSSAHAAVPPDGAEPEPARGASPPPSAETVGSISSVTAQPEPQRAEPPARARGAAKKSPSPAASKPRASSVSGEPAKAAASDLGF